MLPRRRVPYRGVELEELDLPGLLARRPELALIDELAHTNAPGRRAPQALRGHRRRPGGGHRRLLDGQRPAPRVAQRPGRRPDRRPRPGDGARRGARARRRARARRPDAGGPDRAPAGGQGLPGRARADARSTASSGSRTCRPCARWPCARSPRTSARAAGPRAARSCARTGSSRDGRRRADQAERLLALVELEARASASSGARGARRSGWPPSSTSSSSATPERSPGAAERERLEALRRLASVLGAHLIVEEGQDPAEVVGPRGARARHDLRPRGRPARAPRPRGPADAAARCGSCRRCPRSTCGSSPTARGRRGDAVPRREARRRRVSPPAVRAAPPRRRR